MAGNRNYDPQRLQELIVYISEKAFGDARFGSIKLNKILFFADFRAFRSLGRSITGAEYQHLPQGPCPEQLKPAMTALGDSLFMRAEQAGPYTQKRPMPTRSAAVDLFDGPEIVIVDAVIDELWTLTNTQCSDLSHETMAWRLTGDGQQIPYGTALLSSDQPTDEDLAWLEGVSRHGALA